MPHAVSSEWSAFQWSPQVNGWETKYATELVDSVEAAHPLINLLQWSCVTSYIDVHSPSVAEYESEDIPKIHLTAEEPSWNPSSE